MILDKPLRFEQTLFLRGRRERGRGEGEGEGDGDGDGDGDGMSIPFPSFSLLVSGYLLCFI